jgi:hypothetical protein
MISTSEVQQDRSKVAGGEPYEIQYFAKKHGITRDQAQRLIKRMGNNRKKLDEAAAKLKAAIVRRAERLLSRPQTEGSYRAAGATPAAADSAYCIPTVSSLRPRQLQPYR